MSERPKKGEVETRHNEVATEGRRIRGLIPFNTESRDMGGWKETISPTALRNADLSELIARVDHTGVPIGRFPKTLDVSEERDGLHWSVTPPKSRQDLLEAIERGDLQAGSWQMIVAKDRWEGDTRHVEQIAELRDVSVVSSPAYEAAAVEYRSRPTTTAPDAEQEKSNDMSETKNEEQAEGRSEEKTEERKAPDVAVKNEPEPALRVEDRQVAAPMGAYEAFKANGFPSEQATIEFGEFRGASFGGTITTLNQVRQDGGELGYDRRWAWPAFPQQSVTAGATSVQVFKQDSRTIPAGTSVIRDIDATSTKPEVSTAGTVTTVPLRQVAAVETNIPNILLEQDSIETIVEVDLRLAIDGGLDQLIKTAVDASGFQAPSTDPLPTSVRKAITTIQGNGYSPDTLLLTPSASETLDTLTRGTVTSDYVWGAGLPAGQLFGLNARVSKVIAAPVVVDSRAFGKLYTSPATLARFEVDAGATNRSNVRLELHAAFDTERQNAAVRIAGS